MDGMINFTKKENKIHLEINLVPAQRANLKLSSKLLTVADVVLGKTEGTEELTCVSSKTLPSSASRCWPSC